jgi:hypothetical protein
MEPWSAARRVGRRIRVGRSWAAGTICVGRSYTRRLSGWCRAWLVGRRSFVSSPSALRASSYRASPRARATRSATSQVGLATPRSRPRIEVASRSAASARASWVRPTSSRRRRIARPRATWGFWLIRTPEPSGASPAMTREQVPGSMWNPCRRPLHGVSWTRLSTRGWRIKRSRSLWACSPISPRCRPTEPRHSAILLALCSVLRAGSEIARTSTIRRP